MFIILYSFRRFLLICSFCFLVSSAHAEDMAAPVNIFVAGKSFDSYQDYAEFRAPHTFKVPRVVDHAVLAPCFVLHLGITDMIVAKVLQSPRYVPDQRVAGITPSISAIMRDVGRPELPARPVHSREALIRALAQAARGQSGPLLVAGGQGRLKVMALQPVPSVSEAPTNP
jgi:hypothetical protein